jgi:DNA-binding CsgD family transcriptional regulator
MAPRLRTKLLRLGAPALSAGKSGNSVSHVLSVLRTACPLVAFLLDGRGGLRWASDQGTARLGGRVLGYGRGLIVLAGKDLTTLTDACLGKPGAEAELREAGLLDDSERLVVRKCPGASGPLFLAVLAESTDGVCPALSRSGTALVPQLGTNELRVARLAADGLPIRDIAAVMGVAESTVRTHLRRVYAKLAVHSRAQLALLLFRGTS